MEKETLVPMTDVSNTLFPTFEIFSKLIIKATQIQMAFIPSNFFGQEPSLSIKAQRIENGRSIDYSRVFTGIITSEDIRAFAEEANNIL